MDDERKAYWKQRIEEGQRDRRPLIVTPEEREELQFHMAEQTIIDAFVSLRIGTIGPPWDAVPYTIIDLESMLAEEP